MDGAQTCAARAGRLNNVPQERHTIEAHGCAGGRLHITQIGRARSAERRTALPALPHRSLRMSASDPAALAATATAPNLWRYVERPPIAPRAATTGVQRSKNFSGDAGMGEASASRSTLSSGLAEGTGRRRLQRSSAAPRRSQRRACRGADRRRLERAALSRAAGSPGCSVACQQLLGILRQQLAIVHHRHDLDAAVRHLVDQAIRSLQHFS